MSSDCALCYRSLKKETINIHIDCGHSFHNSCYMKLFNKDSCPICNPVMNVKCIGIDKVPSGKDSVISTIIGYCNALFTDFFNNRVVFCGFCDGRLNNINEYCWIAFKNRATTIHPKLSCILNTVMKKHNDEPLIQITIMKNGEFRYYNYADRAKASIDEISTDISRGIKELELDD